MKASKHLIWALILQAVMLSIGCENAPESSSIAPTTAASTTQPNNNKPERDPILLQGTVTFDQIPRSQQTGTLQLNFTAPAPARQVKVDAIDQSGTSLYSTVTTEDGSFTMLVPSNTEIAIRVWAEIEDTESNLWRARVIDNTQGNAAYVLETDLLTTGTENFELGIHAASGLKDDTYISQRSSAPFAILDALLDGFRFAGQHHREALPELNVAWSVNNIAAVGDVGAGHIGSSYYSKQYGEPTVFLLGAVNNDADDYDRSVILHEFGHYLMDHISRSDSIGGGHNPGSKLDLRVSFNEAMSNVLASLIDDDPIYSDSFVYVDNNGDPKQGAQLFNLEAHRHHTGGWYSPEALSWFIYDIADESGADDDALSLGWQNIYRVITSPGFLTFEGAVSIYTLLDSAMSLYPALQTPLIDLARQFDIHFQDAYGGHEINDGDLPSTLPLHSVYEGEPLTVCSNSAAQDYNGADVRRLVRLQIDQEGSYRITAQRSSDEQRLTNPEFVLYREGEFVLAGFSAPASLPGRDDIEQPINREEVTHNLTPGAYLLEVFDRSNADNIDDNGGQSCFDVSIRTGGLPNAQPHRACNNLASMLGDPDCLFDGPSGNDAMAF